MKKYHRIFVDGVSYYREYSYEMEPCGHLMTEEEFFQQILDEVIDDEMDIDERRIEAALSRISNREDRGMLETYIRFLEKGSWE